MKRVIFFPIEAGVAHITRSFSIAEELSKKKGVEVLFALNKSKQFLVGDPKIKIVDISLFFGDEGKISETMDPLHLHKFVIEEISLLRKYKPDLVVVDGRITAIVSAKKLGIPFVFVSNTDALPTNVYLPNIGLWRPFDKLLDPIFQILIKRFKNQYVKALSLTAKLVGTTLTKKDFYKMTCIVPEPIEYLPPKKDRGTNFYIGPIWWKGFEKHSPSWLKKIKPDGKTIYLTFGGTGYDPKKLIALSEELLRLGYRVIVSSSNIANLKSFKKLPNLYVEKYLPGFGVSRRVDLVVCHGGIGTLSQALVAGVPSIAIPFNPDQYVHGFRFQELGLGICVANINLPKMVKLDWDDFQSLGRSVSIRNVLKAVEYTMKNRDKFTGEIAEFRKNFIRQNGPKEAADVISKLC